jgi:Ras-related protein Rab-8A
VTFAEGSTLAAKYGVPFIECSAKDNYNITEIFTTIGKPIKDRLLENDTAKPSNNIKINTGDIKGGKGDKKNCEC